MTTAEKIPQPAHVRLSGDSLFCRHCGTKEKILPMSIRPKRLKIFELIGEAFIEEHVDCKETDKSPSKMAAKNIDDWIKGGDNGTSSETIWSVATGHPVERHGWPHDPDDFGRCYRLVKAFPEARAALPMVAAKFPGTPWVPYVREWNQMEALFEEELPKKTAPKLYDLMKKLRAEDSR